MTLVVTKDMLAARFGSIFPHLDERQRWLRMGAAGWNYHQGPNLLGPTNSPAEASL